MALHRSIDEPEPIRPAPGVEEERRALRSRRVAGGTLACPRCDVPVALNGGPVSPSDAVSCPYCAHTGAVREFLTLAGPSRPTRVDVRVADGLWSSRRSSSPG